MSHRFGVFTSNEFKFASAMPYAKRQQLGYLAQDAFNYFLRAGGGKLEIRYVESAFHEHGMRGLRGRLDALDKGAEDLQEIVTLVRPYVKRGEHLDAGPVREDLHGFETLEQIEKAARLGLKMVISICRNFGVDPATGETTERLEREGAGEKDERWKPRPFWHRRFEG